VSWHVVLPIVYDIGNILTEHLLAAECVSSSMPRSQILFDVTLR